MRARPLVAVLLASACHAPSTESTSSSSSTTKSDEGTTSLAEDTSGSTGGGGSSTTSGVGTTGSASTGAATTGDASTSDDSTTSSTGTTTTGEPTSCKKLDILFHIIDGGDLWDTTWALEDLMPHVAQRLEAEFADWDYHLMVINPDGHWGSKHCESKCQEGLACETDVPYPCGVEPDACDRTRGAGMVFPAGGGAANVPCPIDGDQRYLVRGQHDLPGALSCVTRVGAGYDKNKLFTFARTTLDAIDAPLNAPGACNEGFFREDAYLIVFAITPYPDILSEGTPEAWAAELMAHKGGKFDKIYFVGLFNGCDSGIGWKDYEPLFEWAESFYHHQADDACASTVIPYMDPALDYVLGDCQE